MEKSKSPPSFLGYDFSNEMIKYVPFLHLGQSIIQNQPKKEEIRVAVLKQRDISGNYPSFSKR